MYYTIKLNYQSYITAAVTDSVINNCGTCSTGGTCSCCDPCEVVIGSTAMISIGGLMCDPPPNNNCPSYTVTCVLTEFGIETMVV